MKLDKLCDMDEFNIMKVVIFEDELVELDMFNHLQQM